MTERKYVNTSTEIARTEVSEGVFLVLQKNEYGYDDKPLNVYDRLNLEGLDGNSIADLATLASIMQALPEDGYLGRDYEEVLEFLKEWASETAEDAELPFTFTERDGTSNTYTPASLWEASGSCSEWEESAQEGYDYGWNI